MEKGRRQADRRKSRRGPAGTRSFTIETPLITVVEVGDGQESDRRSGTAPDSAVLLADIEAAEKMGIPAVWMTTGGAGLDALTLFAAAAARTERIMMGTSITPVLPRHPVAVAQQVQVLSQLAPGRFRLGIGPSSPAVMEAAFGVEFRAPLDHLREYLHVVGPLLHQGSVDFDGRYYRAHAKIASPVDVPVMASALGPKAFELCGAEADGAISWVCPSVYLRDVAVPAINRGAERAGRAAPPLAAHVPVCIHEDAEEVRAAVRQQFGFFAQAPFYQRMFIAAGFPETSGGSWSDAMIDAMIDAVAISGDESRVKDKLEELSSFGAAEILVSPVAAGADRAGSLDRTLRLLAEAASGGGV